MMAVPRQRRTPPPAHPEVAHVVLGVAVAISSVAMLAAPPRAAAQSLAPYPTAAGAGAPSLEMMPPRPTGVDGPSMGDPHGGASTWLRPVPTEQAERDPRLIPAALGAIMVPCMSDPIFEPDYVVSQGGRVLAKARPGERVFVAPGTYDVTVGSGTNETMLDFEAHVVEAMTTYVPVEWTGLIVDVVDERGVSFRGGYELLEMPEVQYVGLGFGASLRDGERLNTWLLRPGTYMLISSGESYQARKNFYTFRLPPGELVQLRVVMDQETGDVLGAGEIYRNNPVGQGWSINFFLGGSFTFNRADNVLDKQDGMFLETSAFTETRVRYSDDEHLGLGRLNIELGGRIFLPDRPFVTSTDRTDLELVYTYRLLTWLGPYGRVALRTGLLPTILDFPERTNVRRLDEQGNLASFEREVLEAQVTSPFSRVELRLGAGFAAFDVEPVPWFSLTSRIGTGVRQVFTHDLFRVVDTSSALSALDSTSTPLVTLQEEGDVTQVGIEALLIGQLAISRWFFTRIESELFVPYDAFNQPVITFKGTAGFRIASFASLNYVVELEEDPELSPDTQIDQSIILRFAYQLL